MLLISCRTVQALTCHVLLFVDTVNASAVPHATIPAARVDNVSHDRRGETVAICTIEKANLTINRLIKEQRLGAHSPLFAAWA